jgi:hypothetical protein
MSIPRTQDLPRLEVGKPIEGRIEDGKGNRSILNLRVTLHCDRQG